VDRLDDAEGGWLQVTAFDAPLEQALWAEA